MSPRRAFAVMSVCLSVLVSCASEGGQSQQPRVLPPGYAIIEDGNFRIRCGMTNVFLAGAEFWSFFKPDGTEKTRSEFCADHRSDTRISR